MKHRHLPAVCVTLILAVFAGSSVASQQGKTSTKADGKKVQNYPAAVSQDECDQWAKSNAAPSMKMDMEEHARRGMYMLTAPGDPSPLVCLVLKDPFHPARYEKIGTATRTVPGSENTQRYFIQGLQFFYAFDNRESYRPFRYAAYLAGLRLARRSQIKSCAWCYVGEALALSPDINWGRENELDRKVAQQALADADKALQTDFSRNEITKEERDKVNLIIQALKLRFADCPGSFDKSCDCQSPNSKCNSCQDWRNYNYQQAIAAQFDKYQNDPDYVVLFADAVMNQVPWGYWNPDGSPKCPAIGKAQKAIEAALERSPEDKPLHNGLIHWYIHLMEMSAKPHAAEPYARQLAGLAPNAGHLVHMPAHIYYRVGDMPSSIDTNSQAVSTDRNYLCINPNACKERLQHPDGDRYRFGYYPHNIHFELASAVLTGRTDVVASASETLLASAPAKPDGYRADRYRAVYYLTKLNFSTIQQIQGFPKPADVQPFSAVAYEYAQIFADVLARNSKSAERNYANLQQAAQNYQDKAGDEKNPKCDPAGKLPRDINLCIVQIMLLVARARIDTIDSNKSASDIFGYMDEAIAKQDFLPYAEPPQWLYPVRQTLAGLILVKSNNPGDLSQAMDRLKKSLPENSPAGRPIGSGVFPGNAWAYFGLWKIAAKLGLPDEAQKYEKRYRQLWKGSSEPEFLRM